MNSSSLFNLELLTAQDRVILEELGLLLSHRPQDIESVLARNAGYSEICESKLNGKGYFAKKNIASGELAIEVCGVLIGHQTAQHSIQQSMEVHVEPFEMGGCYLNHSCDGNLIVRSSEAGFAQWFAERKISKGEELNYHYALTEFKWGPASSENNIACACGSGNCDGIINSFSMLTEEQQRDLVNKEVVSVYLAHWFRKR